MHEYLSAEHSGGFGCLPSHTEPCTQGLTKLFSNLRHCQLISPVCLDLFPTPPTSKFPLDLHVTSRVSPSLSTTTCNPHWSLVFPFPFYKPRYFAWNISIPVSVCWWNPHLLSCWTSTMATYLTNTPIDHFIHIANKPRYLWCCKKMALLSHVTLRKNICFKLQIYWYVPFN